MRRWLLLAVIVAVSVSTRSAHAREQCWRDPRMEILPMPDVPGAPCNLELALLGAERGETLASDDLDAAATGVVEVELWEPTRSPGESGFQSRPGSDCGTGDALLPPVVRFTALLMAALAMLLVRHFRRVNAVERARPVPVSLLVAERLARASQRRAGVIAAIGIVGVPALVVMGAGPLAIISTVVGSIGLRGFGIAHSVLQLIETAGGHVTAELLSHIVVVRSATSEVRLEVAPRALARELRHAIPTARAKRR